MDSTVVEAIKRISDIGAFGLLTLLIIMAFKFTPKMLDLWTRGVVAMEKIAADMLEHKNEMEKTREAISTHDIKATDGTTAIRSDIAVVRADVIRVEGKVEMIQRQVDN